MLESRGRARIFVVVAASAIVAATVLIGIGSLSAAVQPLSSSDSTDSTAQSQNLQQAVDGFLSTQPVSYGIVIEDLKTGAAASHNADQQFTSASLYKLFVAQGILERVDQGQIQLGSVIGCLNPMITVSSNQCGETLGSRLGWSNQNARLEQLGFSSTSLDKYNLHTSAGDVAKFYEKLYAGTLLSPSSTKILTNLLKAQRVNNRLPLGLPGGTTIAHKTGDLGGLMHDAGIVYGSKTDYLIVVLSGPWTNPANSFSSFAKLSSAIYKALN